MPSLLLIGGVRSGKSSWAVAYANKFHKKTFIATAKEWDDEMRARIEQHRRERGSGWGLVECETDLASELRKAAAMSQMVVVDCLTLWVAGLMENEPDNNTLIRKFIDPVIEQIPLLTCDLLFVTNEVGQGIVPMNTSGRRFRDLQGMINQRFAEACEIVLWFVAGIPTAIKETLPGLNE